MASRSCNKEQAGARSPSHQLPNSSMPVVSAYNLDQYVHRADCLSSHSSDICSGKIVIVCTIMVEVRIWTMAMSQFLEVMHTNAKLQALLLTALCRRATSARTSSPS
jgi:hypothetical protein